jgi:hypothetical protein
MLSDRLIALGGDAKVIDGAAGSDRRDCGRA